MLLSYLLPVCLSLWVTGLVLNLSPKQLLVASTIALVVSFPGAVFLARTLSKPLATMREVTARIARGHLSERVETAGAWELAELGRSINHMAAQLSVRLEQLEAERNHTRTLLASLPDPVLTFNTDGELTYLNPAAQGALELERQEAVGRKLAFSWANLAAPASPTSHEITLPPQSPGRKLLNMAEASVERGSHTMRIGTERTYRVYILPYEDRGRLLVLRDMTDIRRLEEVRTLFLGSVSHELRTPLTIIKGFAVTLLDHPDAKADDMRRQLTKIDTEADRLTRLVNDLLDLTKIQSQRLLLELEPLIPGEAVEDAIGLLNAHAERQGVKLTLERDQNPITLPADRDRLKQVVINLVDNAIKFTPAGGTVKVTTSHDHENWYLHVEDNGPGVSEKDLPQLFDHFFRSRDVRKVGGTGLGLAIVKQIVSMHRGQIRAESQLGEGTRIVVTLPYM